MTATTSLSPLLQSFFTTSDVTETGEPAHSLFISRHFPFATKIPGEEATKTPLPLAVG